MSAELANRAGDAVTLAKAAGADDVWASALQQRTVQFVYRDGALETVKDNTARTLAIQVYAAGRYSTSQTTDLRPDRLARFLTEAVATTRALEPDADRKITPAELFANRPDMDLDLVDSEVAKIERHRRLAWCEALDGAARNHPKMISATSRVSDGTLQAASASSNGFEHTHTSTSIGLSAFITLKDQGDKRAASGYWASGQHLDSLPSPEHIAGKALELTVARLGAQKGPTTTTTMVVDARVAGSLVRRLLAAGNANLIQQGRSYWTPFIDKEAFSKILTITDDPLIPRGLGSRLADSEGISSRVLPIVEEGSIRNVYVDTYYGRKTGMAPTTGSMSNVRVALGTKSLDELIAEAGNGIYVTGWIGGNADTTTGDYSLGLRGHLIEQGKVSAAVMEMNATGNLRTLFSQLVAVGNDPFPYSTVLAPSLTFADVDFSGA